MTLSFSTNWADGSPTYFIPKIWKGIYSEHKDQFHKYCDEQYLDTLKEGLGNFAQKLHTIREDKGDRWKVGNKIHPVINNRTKDRFQFCPTLECKRIQIIKMQNYFSAGSHTRKIYINNSIKPFYELHKKGSFLNKLNSDRMNQLVKNDGFDDIESFFNFFFPNGTEGTKTLKIIHWTDLKY